MIIQQGHDATLQVMVEELQLLWDHGILVDGTRWRVAMINGIWDGKGYEQACFTDINSALCIINLLYIQTH